MHTPWAVGVIRRVPDDLKAIEAEVRRRLERHRARMRAHERRAFGSMDDAFRRADDVFAAADHLFEQTQRAMDEAVDDVIGGTWQRIVQRAPPVVAEEAFPDEPPPRPEPMPAPAPKSLWERLDESEEAEPKAPAPEAMVAKASEPAPNRPSPLRRISGLTSFSIGVLLMLVGAGLWLLWHQVTP